MKYWYLAGFEWVFGLSCLPDLATLRIKDLECKCKIIITTE